MATGFSTRSGPDGYRLNFDTDNLDYYLLMQKIARHCVDGKPAADVAPVRHGRWEKHPQSNEDDPVYTCSLCKLNVSGFEKRWIKYCPNCGALMQEEDNGEK